MAYTPRDWTDVPLNEPPPDGAPALDAANLSRIEDGISAAHDEIDGRLSEASLTGTIGAEVGPLVGPAIGAAINDLDVAAYQPGNRYLPGALATHAGRLWYALPYQGVSSVTTRTNHITDPRFTTEEWHHRASAVPTVIGGAVDVSYPDALPPGTQSLRSPDAPTVPDQQWSTGITVHVPTGYPPVELLVGIGYSTGSGGMNSPTTARQVVSPGETLRIVHTSAALSDSTVAGLRIQAISIPEGARVVYSEPVLEHGPTAGDFFDGDLPDATAPGETRTYTWQGTPHHAPSLETTTHVTPRPAPGEDSEAWAAIREAATVHPIGTLAATPEPVAANTIPQWMDRTRTKTWAGGSTHLRESLDDGQTWTTIQTWSGYIVAAVREFGNGELVVGLTPGDLNSPTQLWVSEGYPTHGADATWSPKVEPTAPTPIRFTGAWSMFTHDNIGLAAEYGPKEGYAGVEPGDNARYVYMSIDHGKTWVTIFDLNEHVTNTHGVHLHGVAWDRWWDRIWITHGDSQNGTLYSDDLGATWHHAHFNATGTSEHQNVGILPMPDCILFGTDTTPNGVQRINRTEGKRTGTYPIDIAYAINDEPVRNALCHGIIWVGEDHPAFFAFGAETRPLNSSIVATRDGYHFEKVWEDEHTSPAGRGLRGVVGPTIRGQLHSRISDPENQPQSWMRVTGPAPGY